MTTHHATAQGTATAVAAAPTPIDATYAIERVTLRVANLDAMRAYWTEVIGLDELDINAGDAARAERALLGVDSTPLIELVALDTPHAPAHNATGLYHVAIRVPTRRDLAVVIQRIAMLQAPIDGASDHGVSEALYLTDPEGNGIEIYHDAPFEAWDWGRQGTIIQPMDIEGVMSTIASEPADDLLAMIRAGLPTGTDIGHVHLKVDDVATAQEWYRSTMGLDITLEIAGSAAFASAAGYHHHVGMNVWHSRGGSPADVAATGLDVIHATVADAVELAALARRAAMPAPSAGDAVELVDPAGNRWSFTARD